MPYLIPLLSLSMHAQFYKQISEHDRAIYLLNRQAAQIREQVASRARINRSINVPSP
jgi:hypothetical protein